MGHQYQQVYYDCLKLKSKLRIKNNIKYITFFDESEQELNLELYNIIWFKYGIFNKE